MRPYWSAVRSPLVASYRYLLRYGRRDIVEAGNVTGERDGVGPVGADSAGDDPDPGGKIVASAATGPGVAYRAEPAVHEDGPACRYGERRPAAGDRDGVRRASSLLGVPVPLQPSRKA